jgi:hypothetical protein
MGGRNGRVAGGDRDLMQVRDDVSYRTRHGTVVCPCLWTTRHPTLVWLAPRWTARFERTSQKDWIT